MLIKVIAKIGIYCSFFSRNMLPSQQEEGLGGVRNLRLFDKIHPQSTYTKLKKTKIV
jgi:hypothetical protein